MDGFISVFYEDDKVCSCLGDGEWSAKDKTNSEKFKVAKHKVALSWTDYEKSDFWERTLQSIK